MSSYINHWYNHLESIRNSTIHFIPSNLSTLEDIRRDLGRAKDIRFILTNGVELRSCQLLMENLAKLLCFPKYFGKNWDALYDCLTDLEWMTGTIVVLTIDDADALLQMPNDDLSKFSSVVNRTIDYWQNPPDSTEMKRSVTNFHLILRAEHSAFGRLMDWISRPICIHGKDQ